MDDAPVDASKRKVFWIRLADLARPLWLQLLAIILLSFLATPLALLSPIPIKIAVDSVIGDAPLPHWLSTILPAVASTKRGELFVAAGLMLLVAILASLQSLASWLLQTYTGERLVHDFRGQLLWHVQ